MLNLVLLAAAVAANAPEWENPAVNSLNRLPARAYSMPLADEKTALADALEPETPYRKSLNGTWKFSWAGEPSLRVKDFWKTDFDDANWFAIDVPSCVELRGFGTPGYTNVRFPTADTTTPSDKNFAKVLDRDTKKPNYNPVSSYRTTFTVPADWKGRDVILRFDGVYSAYYVWVNGQKVGYAEDSKLPSEFDITKYLNEQPTTNHLAVEVYRWCDGSFLEDQDMFRFSGIYRDVTLWAKPKDGIDDFLIRTRPLDGYERWSLEVAVESSNPRDKTEVTLYDADKNEIGKFNCQPQPQPPTSTSTSTSTGELTLKPRLWSAEDPYLYTLVVKKNGDIRSRKIGFKEQKIVGNTFMVNGKPVKFKGVNRHECSPENGRTVSLDEMIMDITLMKRHNVNTVRTCHYPDHHTWYDLCDRYGLYVVAEANVEGHEPGYDARGLGLFKEWEPAIVERNERNCVFHRANPCVTMWSMGNETGHGDAFRHAIAAVRRLDPSRPIHWERGNADADVDSTMYPSVEWLEKRGKLGDATGDAKLAGEAGGEGYAISGHTAGKCGFLCEYAHAMGNAIGNFQEYWDVFYAHPSLCGGCIWDWVDQALWKYTDKVDPKTGKRERFLAYGGDFDEEPNDGPFCCNGVIHADRKVTAKLVEVGHVYRNLVVTRVEGAVFELWNRYLFTPADAFDARWTLVANGVPVKEGAFATPAVTPLKRCRFTVDGLEAELAKLDASKEWFINFAFQTKVDAPWAPKGWIVARDQIALGGAYVAPKSLAADVPVAVTEDDKTVAVTRGGTKAVFCRKSGALCELTLNGKTVLKDPAVGVVAGPRLTLARAFTDNDRWMRDGNSWSEDRKAEDGFYSKGLTQLSYHARPIKVAGEKVTVVVEVTGQKSAGYTHTAVYAFNADGSIDVANETVPHGHLPAVMPRLGLSLRLDRDLEAMRYYGRGPRENYVDRKTASFLGLWESTVTEQYEDYVRPQDNGYKCDVRYVEFFGKDGKGVRFSASEPLFVQALHYGREDLEFARHRNGQKRFRTPLVAQPDVFLNLDVRQTGLGGASCGPGPMDKYRYRPNETTRWTLTITPASKM